jgi:diguanylate cyclase (GGDEF)-like protein/PAS domain S-box-containing protein
MDVHEQLQSLKDSFFTMDQQFQSTASALPDPVFIIDKNGRYLDVVGGQERTLYHRPDFLIGKDLHTVLPLDLANIFLETISDSIETDSLKVLEYQLGPEDVQGTTNDGPEGKQWFEGRVYPIKDKSDEVSSVVWMAINITRKKKLEKKLKNLSEKDPLTGAFNRRYFMQIFEQSYSIAKRYNNPFSVMVLDIDNFKSINDTFGHKAGDTVLKTIVDYCKVSFRDADLFARLGGEEFIVMLPNTPTLGAAIIAERIRDGIHNLPVTLANKTVHFSISIGISQVDESDEDYSDVISRADMALYQAKDKGKNRVEIN